MKSLKEKVSELPTCSGVYVMLAADFSIIYVGKAKNLKNRVSQYFTKTQKHSKVQAMVNSIYDFQYYVTLTERDALALENNLIKKHQPFYNILLKDDKTYPYIKINTNMEFPTIEVTRKIKKDKCKYFGPYISGINPYHIIDALHLAYPVRQCKIAITKKPKKPCLYYELGRCYAPCAHYISSEDYQKFIKKATDFLNGNDSDIEKILRQKMENYSTESKFEQALVLRDTLKMINSLKQKVVADLPTTMSIDVFAYYSDGINGTISTLKVAYGKILGIVNQSVFDASLYENEILDSYILQYYQNNTLPNLVLTSCTLSSAVSQMIKVKIECPSKGQKARLVQTAKINAQEHTKKQSQKQQTEYTKTVVALENLKQKLGLLKMPRKIECYDISHIGGTNTVASMVVFVDGKPAKKLYRRFRMEGINKIDDFECLRQTIKRRIAHLSGADQSFGELCDLMVIDGGKGQLSGVCEVLKENKINVDIISLAKREEEVFLKNDSNPVILKRGSSELNLLQSIRDEAHRFAITYHRKLRSKESIKSSLNNISGLGEVKIKNLLSGFESITAIKKASVDELSLIKGIDRNLAKKIYEYYNKEE